MEKKIGSQTKTWWRKSWSLTDTIRFAFEYDFRELRMGLALGFAGRYFMIDFLFFHFCIWQQEKE